jgi:hypothetical protein
LPDHRRYLHWRRSARFPGRGNLGDTILNRKFGRILIRERYLRNAEAVRDDSAELVLDREKIRDIEVCERAIRGQDKSDVRTGGRKLRTTAASFAVGANCALNSVIVTTLR